MAIQYGTSTSITLENAVAGMGGALVLSFRLDAPPAALYGLYTTLISLSRGAAVSTALASEGLTVAGTPVVVTSIPSGMCVASAWTAWSKASRSLKR